MPRERKQWELCESNTFSGIHTWMLDIERDETGQPQKDGKDPPRDVARCHVCGGRPPSMYEGLIIRELEDSAKAFGEAQRRRTLLRQTFGRKRAR